MTIAFTVVITTTMMTPIKLTMSRKCYDKELTSNTLGARGYFVRCTDCYEYREVAREIPRSPFRFCRVFMPHAVLL